MLGAYIKKMFGGEREVPPNQQFYSPLRVALHSTVELNTIDWLGMKDKLNQKVILPNGGLSVIAIGTIETDGAEIFNIYLIDSNNKEFTLQLFCADNRRGGDLEVIESTLYYEVQNVTPLTQEDWDDELHFVGKKTFQLDGNEYARVWADDYEGKIDLIPFEEHVVLADEELDYVNNYVLYKRSLEAPYETDKEWNEFLIVGVEETETDAMCVKRIGINLPQNAISVQ